MKKWILSAFALVFFVSTLAFADRADHTAAQKVIENWFAAMKDAQMDKAGGFLAPEFVSIHTDGKVRDKAQELQLIKNLNMKNYHLSDFRFSQRGDVIVATFKDKGQEMIDNKPIGPNAAGRMAVLQKENDQWLILGYANLDTLK